MPNKPTYDELEQRIKELEQTEQKLKESEEKYKSYISHFQGIAYHGNMDFSLDFFSGIVEEITGYTEAEFISSSITWPELVHPEDWKNLIEPDIEKVTTILNLKLVREFRIIDKHGNTKWLKEYLNNTSENGVLTGVRGALYDISEQRQTEQSLQESERFFSQMFEQSIVSTQLLDPEGNTLRVNPPFCELFGVTPDDMKYYKIFEDEAIKQSDAYEPLLDVFNNKNSRRWYNSFDIALASESSGVKTTKPEVVYLENLSYPILDKDGNLLYAVIQHHDITKKVEADKALQESEQLLKSIADNFPNSFLSVINEDYTIGWSGGQEFKNQGINPDDFVGLTLEDVFGENAETIRQYYDKTFAGENQEFELFANEQHQLYRTVALPSNGHKRMVSVVENITKRKKAEEALKESKENFQAIVENTENAVTVLDTKGIFLYANKNSAIILGLKPNELIDKSVYDFFPKEFADGRVETLRKVVESQKADSHLIETPIAGDYISFSSDMIPLRYGGKDAVLTVSTDITDIIETQNALKASLKEKETLLHEVHHRVKNNMQVIISLLKLQSNTIKDPKIKDILKESQNRVYTMSAVHETLHRSENLSEIDLKVYLSKVTNTVFQSYSTDNKNVKLNNNIEESIISLNQAYPLGLVINELISNSLKYAFPEDKTGEITVSMKKLSNQLELTVKDDGIGISEDFDWKNSGSLGLKLVRTLVENQFDGSIDMESKNGTKFTIKFNLA